MSMDTGMYLVFGVTIAFLLVTLVANGSELKAWKKKKK